MTQTPYKAIFFDLDGTLLPLDMDAFMHNYLSSIGRFVASHGLDVDAFSTGLDSGIRAMASDDSAKSNARVFWDTFFDVVPEDPEVWGPLFKQFYDVDFGAIGEGVAANPLAAESLSLLQEKGYPLVLATMPMFPQRAVDWRCEWAGIDPQVFSRITNFENSTSIKPKLAYYAENLKAANLAPHEVLMVGNNTREDLACMELGIDAYLITDHVINHNEYDLAKVKHGSYGDFLDWIEGFGPCVDPAQSFVTELVGS